MNNRTKEAKELAKKLFWVTNNQSIESHPAERETLKEEYNQVVSDILSKGHSVNDIMLYMEEYQELKVGEHHAWINGN